MAPITTVFAHAIDRYLLEGADADTRFVLTPLVTGLEPEAFYNQLIKLANRHPGKVLMVEGYLAQLQDVQAGACWSVWPSLYEPCGGGTEPLAMGTPLVARETGGLPRQLRDEASGSLCGVLYREAVSVGLDQGKSWKMIEGTPDPFERLAYTLYNSMVDALKERIVEAVNIRTKKPETYAKILTLTTRQVKDEFFSPERFARDYWSLYQVAITT